MKSRLVAGGIAAVVIAGAVALATQGAAGASTARGLTGPRFAAYGRSHYVVSRSAHLHGVRGTGVIAVKIHGLPAGTPARVRLTGPGKFARTIGHSRVFRHLAWGTYHVRARRVTVVGVRYAPHVVSRSLEISGSELVPDLVRYTERTSGDPGNPGPLPTVSTGPTATPTTTPPTTPTQTPPPATTPTSTPPTTPSTTPASAPPTTPSTTPASTPPTTPTSTSTPDTRGTSFQALYLVPSGATPDLSAPGAIANDLAAVDGWFGTQTVGGLIPRWVRTPAGAISVVTVSLPQTASAYSTSADELSAIYTDLGSLGWPQVPGEKLVAYIDTTNTGGWCAITGGYLSLLTEAACTIYPSTADTWPYGATYVMGHEMTHNFGADAFCSPHSDHTGHVNDSNRDVIYQGPLGRDWNNLVLDANHDDYYDTNGANNATCPNSDIITSPYWASP